MPVTSADMTNSEGSPYRTNSSLHRTLVMEAVLIVLDDRGDGLEHRRAVGSFDDVLQIEILDREVVVAVAERATNRRKVGLLHRLDHISLLGDVALDGRNRAVDEERGII